MKSIKPGRGPSKLGAVGGIFTALFGIFWCFFAASIGAWFMIPFGIVFVAFSVYIAFYHGHNATSEDRYSLLDIVDENEEADPLNEKYGRKKPDAAKASDEDSSGGFCPYCGKAVKGDFDFCPGCGKSLPR